MKRKNFFILSGEHPTLPKSEIIALLNTYSIKYKKILHKNQLYVIETEKNLSKNNLDRLTMTKRVCKLLFISKDENKLLDKINSYNFSYLSNKSFKISIKQKNKLLNSNKVKKEIGQFIKTKYESQVNLNNPDYEIFIFCQDKIYVGITEFIQKNRFSERRPQKKPYFVPGTTKAKLARVLVNLARLKENQKLLDPFCGCGGFLIEAGLMNIDIVGYDIDKNILKCAKNNLDYYGIKNYKLDLGDATKIKVRDIDAIVCDPPYGISTKMHIRNLDELYNKSIKNLSKYLKKNSYFVILSPDDLQLEKIGEDNNLKLKKIHYERVHKSLTRKICVFQK